MTLGLPHLELSRSVLYAEPRIAIISPMDLIADSLLNANRLVPFLSLMGVVLDALGGLYLAYDLLGGKRGPLRQISRLLTYSVILGLGYGITLGLWFGLAGAFVTAPTIYYQLTRRARGSDPTNFEWNLMASMRGAAFGVAGWLMVGPDFGIAFGILSALAMNIAYVAGFDTNIYRPYQKPGLDRYLTMAGIVRGLMIGLAGAISGAITRRPAALSHGIQIGVVVGALNTAVTLLSPPIEWWADNLPERVLGGYGAFLLLVGSALQTVQYVAQLLELSFSRPR